MNQLNDIQLWKKELGLLPINLFSGNLNDEFIFFRKTKIAPKFFG